MSRWVLDTDMVTLLLRGNPRVCERVSAVSPAEVTTTIITVEELLTGWYAQIRRVRDDAKLIRAYEGLRQTVEFCRTVHILDFDLAALERFHRMRTSHRRIGTNDLRIAAIVIERQAVLVTRNRQDFEPLPGLALDDWS